jgi:hypothetical protein
MDVTTAAVPSTHGRSKIVGDSPEFSMVLSPFYQCYFLFAGFFIHRIIRSSLFHNNHDRQTQSYPIAQAFTRSSGFFLYSFQVFDLFTVFHILIFSLCTMMHSSSPLLLLSRMSSHTTVFAVPPSFPFGFFFLSLMYLFCFLNICRLLFSVLLSLRRPK